MRSQSSASAQRKKLEEQNAQAIRKLLTLPENKFCFECGQRGPTYVNVTNYTFCCMHCSGLVRGLHPPHRVKSISMATFTAEEVERLRSGGNAANASIYLGLYDGKMKFEPRTDDAVRAHLVEKYENRRWYVSPGDVELQKRLLEEHEAQRRSSVSGQSVKSHKSNQSAPANLHNAKPAGPVDLLTGDLFDLSFDSAPAIPTPAVAAPIRIPQAPPAASLAAPPSADDDWTSLFTDPAPPKAPAMPMTSLPFSSSVPAPLRFPMPAIPPPKSKDHHSVTFADLNASPEKTATPTTGAPAGWEVFSSGVPKSATVSTINQTQPPAADLGLFDVPAAPVKRVPPPLPSSLPVASKPMASNGSSGDPFADLSSQPTPKADNWNPFLS